ncbi:MAG TPA: zinc-binding dehydrogenase [Puia sp.]|nr:zinc-binding dehydrogenase [Puia sp.]
MNNTIPHFPPGKAALFNGQGRPFEHISRSLPMLRAGEILVKTRYTTICGSDIHTYNGRRLEPPQVVLGHEIVGDILWIDQAHRKRDLRGNPLECGDRITWSIFAVPQGVTAPREDMPQKSERLFKYGHHLAEGDDVFNGGFAEYCILRANTAIIKIPSSIPAKVAATINCAHATVAGALRVAGNIANLNVLVFGAGLLGLSCVAMCREAKASTIGLIDVDHHRLQWGEQFGADSTYEFPSESTETDPMPWPDADIVFDMTGNPKAMKAGIESLALGGCAVWIGAVFPSEGVPVDAQRMVRKILTIRGLHNYNYEDFLEATLFIEDHYQKYPFEKLVEKEFVMEDIDNAFAYASKERPVRVGIRFDGE